MMSDYKVEMINDGMQEFYVHFHGPAESNLLCLFSQSFFFFCLCVKAFSFLRFFFERVFVVFDY